MGIFDRKEKIVKVDGEEIALQPKPRLGFMRRWGRQAATRQPSAQAAGGAAAAGGQQRQAKRQARGSGLKNYLEGVASKQKGLEEALKERNIKSGVYEFAKRMFIAAIAIGIVIGAFALMIFNRLLAQKVSEPLPVAALLAAVIAYAVFRTSFANFLNYPKHRARSQGNAIEANMLFAARHLILSLRAGMPLFNAIVYVSSGYGEASKEFAKIVDMVQLGTSLEHAMEETAARSASPTFRRVMLQAYSSLLSGANVEAALQSIVDQVSQERLIEQRRFGQKLNALAMFYMLFGVILPSIGIAVATILTTFVSAFTINGTVLAMGIVGILLMQIVFLRLMSGARPVTAA